MQENKEKTNTNNEGEGKPKRRIVHRVIRRVPKAKPIVIEEGAPSIIKHADFPANVLANEKPVAAAVNEIEQAALIPGKQSISPKEMVFHELRQSTSDKQISKQFQDTPNDSGAKNPIANIWPYIAASKQESKNNIESRDENFEEEDLEDEAPAEHNYFSWIPWVIIPLIVTGIVIFVLSYLSGAEVVITPKTKSATVATDLISEKNGDQTKSIPLTILLIEDKVTTDVPATESKATIATASGKVTVSNKQKIVQTLIKTTRFESSDGKIYRIRDNIKVPAAIGDKPGTVTVMVYAESAGPDYNKKDITDFTVPGFKGKPQFQLVTAKSIGAIEGGSSGVKKSVPVEAMDDLSKNMKIELENKLRARVPRELLQNQISYESLYQFDYKNPALEASDAPEKARIGLSGTLAVPIFVKSDLSRELAKSNIEGYAGEDISLDKIEQLIVKYSDNQKVNLFTDSKVSYNFSGEAKFTWVVDSKAFAKALINVSKDDATRVSKKFSGIDTTSVVIHPFWKSYFPSNVNDIKVTVVGTEK